MNAFTHSLSLPHGAPSAGTPHTPPMQAWALGQSLRCVHDMLVLVVPPVLPPDEPELVVPVVLPVSSSGTHAPLPRTHVKPCSHWIAEGPVQMPHMWRMQYLPPPQSASSVHPDALVPTTPVSPVSPVLLPLPASVVYRRLGVPPQAERSKTRRAASPPLMTFMAYLCSGASAARPATADPTSLAAWRNAASKLPLFPGRC